MRLVARWSVSTAAASSLSLFGLLASVVNAQNTDTNAPSTDANADPNTAKTTAAATSANKPASVSITAPNLSTVTETPGATDSAASTTAPTTTVTNTPTLSSTNSIFHLSDVPTIAGYGVPTQVVPWTAGAPYMQRSSLPEGTVFIVVGAILGFMGAAVVLWRALVAWSLHRSVRKAAMTSHRNDSMLKLSKPNPFGGGAYRASNMSLERLSAPTGKLSKHARASSNATSGRPSSLFFSPTAGAGTHSSPTSALMSGNYRSSTFLPAGYYAAPSAASPGGVAGSAPNPLSILNPLHPSRAGYARQSNNTPSPPGSPGPQPSSPNSDFLPRTRGYAGGHERSSGYGRPSPEHGMYSQGGSSQLNLHVPGGADNGGRAPSANLEDMFDAHGNGSRERL